MNQVFIPIAGPLDKSRLPEPVYDENPRLVDFYDLAWRQAWEHVYECLGAPVSPYMSEGLKSDRIWIWDTCFMVNFCRYGAGTFPGIQSLDNFYRVMHDSEHMVLKVHHPDNPPLFAWTEYQYFKLTGDYDRIERILLDKQYLQKHFFWLEQLMAHAELPLGNSTVFWEKSGAKGYHWSGNPSGMDNTPRGRGDYGRILWLDAAAQQGLSALYIARLARIMDRQDIADEWFARYEEFKTLLNDLYWSEEDGIYYDILAENSKFCKVLTPASFWPMMAEMPPREQAEKMVKTLLDPRLLGGHPPMPTVSRNDPDFTAEGCYWRGSIWLPTSYMTVKALEKYGMHDLARKLSVETLDHMLKTYQEHDPHTIWECYSPTAFCPGTNSKSNISRADFCGWSALGPISLFIENILGFHDIDAQSQMIHWNKTSSQKCGIRNLRFGDNCVDLVAEGNDIAINAAKPFTLVFNGMKHSCPAGTSTVSIEN
jgi:glycogen debranching enzyme